jgi:hypothetical protein
VSEVIEAVERDSESGLIVNNVKIEDAHGQLLATALFRMLVRRRPMALGDSEVADSRALSTGA